jgi:hypothetical protein
MISPNSMSVLIFTFLPIIIMSEPLSADFLITLLSHSVMYAACLDFSYNAK